MAEAKPLRIAMLSVHSSPIGPLGTQNTGGMSVYVRETARWMGRWGHKVDIFTYAQGAANPMDLYPNVRLIDLAPDGRDKISKEDLFEHLPSAAASLERYAGFSQTMYQLVQSHYWISGVVGGMVCKRWNCPHLIMFHTLGKIKNTSTAGESEPERRIRHETRLAEQAHGIVVPSDGEQKNVIHHLGAPSDKVHLIPCGVNLDHFKPMDKATARQRLNIDRTAPVLLYVGRFAPVKGLDRLLEAVARLVPRYPDLKLVVAGGDGPAAKTTREVTDLAEKLGIMDHLALAGRVHHDLLTVYYGAADIVALPSFYESFGLVTLEALACGTPVAATCTGGAEAVITDGINGILIEAPGTTDMTRGLDRLLTQVLQDGFSTQKVRRSVADFGWDKIAASLLKTYGILMEPA